MDGISQRIKFIRNEFLCFHNIFVMALLEEEVHMMVHIIPQKVRVGHHFHNIFIGMEYGVTRGRETT